MAKELSLKDVAKQIKQQEERDQEIGPKPSHCESGEYWDDCPWKSLAKRMGGWITVLIKLPCSVRNHIHAEEGKKLLKELKKNEGVSDELL